VNGAGGWRVQRSTFCTREVSVFEVEAFLLGVAEDTQVMKPELR
jgi:hypothetical protein